MLTYFQWLSSRRKKTHSKESYLTYIFNSSTCCPQASHSVRERNYNLWRPAIFIDKNCIPLLQRPWGRHSLTWIVECLQSISDLHHATALRYRVVLDSHFVLLWSWQQRYLSQGITISARSPRSPSTYARKHRIRHHIASGRHRLRIHYHQDQNDEKQMIFI